MGTVSFQLFRESAIVDQTVADFCCLCVFSAGQVNRGNDQPLTRHVRPQVDTEVTDGLIVNAELVKLLAGVAH